MSGSLDLSSLNPAQKAAVENTEGAVLVIAGPGSGKTRVLTFRVAYLIQHCQVPPYRIMVLTFTKKAAEEMVERLHKIIGEEVKKLQIGTFHRIFYRILRRHTAALGYAPDISIYDTGDSRTLIKRIVKELKLDEKTYLPKSISRRIGEAKRAFMDAKTYQQEDVWLEEDVQRKQGEFHRIYMHYENRCKAANAMDYDDLLLKTHQLLRHHPEVLRRYQERFRYLLVDEFQDTDKVQYAILKLLAKGHGNLCVIGDDAQSIYGFRGADISNIRGFTKAFPSPSVFKLEQNYRSTKHILKAAEALINHNEQSSKKLFTENPMGEPVLVFPMSSDLEEAFFVAKEIKTSVGAGGFQYDDIAVIYRSNRQSRLLEEALLKENIPYQVIGGLSFYERKEIKDVLAYLQLVVNQDHEEAMWRVINLPKRNIGPATIARLQDYATRHHCKVWEAAAKAKDWLSGRVGAQLQAFVELIEHYGALLETKNAYEIIQGILRDSGLEKMMRADLSIEGVTRWDNVQELVEALFQFAQKQGKLASLESFLRDVALLETPEKRDQGGASVGLMTAHRTKGLEFGKVFITGAEEKLFPHNFSMYSNQEVEEERRLFFVAITRAKQSLIITYAVHRHVLGALESTTPSRFLKEIAAGGVVLPPTFAQPQTSSRRRTAFTHTTKKMNGDNKTRQQSIDSIPTLRRSTQHLVKPSTRVVHVDTTPYQVGVKVAHPRFGIGTIVSLEEERLHPKVVVHFLSGGQRSLLLAFAKLKILT